MNETDLAIFRAIYGAARSTAADLFFAAVSTSALGWLMFLVGLPLLALKPWRGDILRHLVAVVSSATAPALKTFFHHDRPSKMLWVQEQESVHSDSFPSGHTAAAFVVAITWSFALARWGHARWIPLLILWATLVGISRIYRGVHWPSDVLGGALWGTILAIGIEYAWPKGKPQPDSTEP